MAEHPEQALLGESGCPDLPERNIFYMAARMTRCLPTSWLHFILVEFRAIYGVWAACFNYAVALQPGSNAYFWKFDNVAGYWNIPIFAYCILLNLIGLALLMKDIGMAQFTDPRYLKFTYELENKCWYKIAVKILIILCVLVSFRSYLFMVWGLADFGEAKLDETGKPDDKLMSTYEFGYTYFSQIALLMGIVTALEMTENRVKKEVFFTIKESIEVHIDWNGEAFQRVKFTRTILDLFSQTNDAFGKKLITALWLAQSCEAGGEAGGKLFQCVDKESWGEAMKIKGMP